MLVTFHNDIYDISIRWWQNYFLSYPEVEIALIILRAKQRLRTDAMHRSSAVFHVLDDQTKSLGRVLRFDDILLEIYGASVRNRHPKRSPFPRARDVS